MRNWRKEWIENIKVKVVMCFFIKGFLFFIMMIILSKFNLTLERSMGCYFDNNTAILINSDQSQVDDYLKTAHPLAKLKYEKDKVRLKDFKICKPEEFKSLEAYFLLVLDLLLVNLIILAFCYQKNKNLNFLIKKETRLAYFYFDILIITLITYNLVK